MIVIPGNEVNEKSCIKRIKVEKYNIIIEKFQLIEIIVYSIQIGI